uniref:Ribonuclease 1 n=2 Tax=Panax ginseng TaxID=4054 RepID=RNS1_PANGI|nr:RecName: Full=Ribonuclease 1 [Panax ginseng]
GVQKTEVEATSTVPAQKLYAGLLLDIDDILPKAFPQAIKSSEIIEGDGGVGTVKLVTLGEASQFNTMKQRIDAIDKDALTYTYSIIGGDILLDIIESIVNHFTIVPTPDGGSIVKNTTIYNTIGDAVIPEENIKDATEKAGLIFKAVEAYLLAN